MSLGIAKGKIKMSGSNDYALLAARMCIGALFLAGTWQKVAAPEAVASLLSGKSLSPLLVWPAMAFNLLASIALFAGFAVRPVALALAGYCILTSWFHFIPSDGWQMSIFIKNWAIAGGCLALWVAGSGRIALRPDRLIT